MQAAKLQINQTVRAVRGPGGALQAERRFLGQRGRVVGVQEFLRTCPCYVVEFEFDNAIEQDTIDETCLESAP